MGDGGFRAEAKKLREGQAGQSGETGLEHAAAGANRQTLSNPRVETGEGMLRRMRMVILRWHGQLIARKWTYATGRRGRPGVLAEIRRLVVRMAEENPT